MKHVYAEYWLTASTKTRRWQLKGRMEMPFWHFVMLYLIWCYRKTLLYVCPSILLQDVSLVHTLLITRKTTASVNLLSLVNNSVAEFISRSSLRLLIWSRRTSPRCWHSCSTRCPEGCTHDSWWWFAAGRQWKASWSHSICSSVSPSWFSGLWGNGGKHHQCEQ